MLPLSLDPAAQAARIDDLERRMKRLEAAALLRPHDPEPRTDSPKEEDIHLLNASSR